IDDQAGTAIIRGDEKNFVGETKVVFDLVKLEEIKKTEINSIIEGETHDGENEIIFPSISSAIIKIKSIENNKFNIVDVTFIDDKNDFNEIGAIYYLNVVVTAKQGYFLENKIETYSKEFAIQTNKIDISKIETELQAILDLKKNSDEYDLETLQEKVN